MESPLYSGFFVSGGKIGRFTTILKTQQVGKRGDARFSLIWYGAVGVNSRL